MSILPMIFSNWWEDLEEPHHVHDQHFGLGIHSEHLSLMPESVLHPHLHHHHRQTRGPHPRSHYYRPWGGLLRRTNEESGVSTVSKPNRDQFQVVLDVQQFSPEEISVKVVDKHVIVEGSHEEKKDEHGWISRKFTRRYLVPEQCNLDAVSSELSSDGVLKITVPRKELPAGAGERVIQIQKTGKPALKEQPQTQPQQPEKKN